MPNRSRIAPSEPKAASAYSLVPGASSHAPASSVESQSPAGVGWRVVKSPETLRYEPGRGLGGMPILIAVQRPLRVLREQRQRNGPAEHQCESTGARFHPLEILLSLAIKLAVITALGAPAEAAA